MAGGYSGESARRALPNGSYSASAPLLEKEGAVELEGRLFRLRFRHLALVTVRWVHSQHLARNKELIIE